MMNEVLFNGFVASLRLSRLATRRCSLSICEKHSESGKSTKPLELLTILDQNFVKDPDGSWRVPDPKKEADLEHICSAPKNWTGA